MEWVSTLSIAELVHPRLGKILESTRWLSPEAETCLNLIPREWKVFSADTMINLEELQSAIRHTKKNTSAGCCGWTLTTRLTCVPIALLKKLVELWNSFLLGQRVWPDSMKLAKIVTPRKKEVTKSMMDVRPITILSLLYRVLSKAWTKKLWQEFPTLLHGPFEVH